MGQQLSSEDQDEGFKNIISRMLQEADNEEIDNPPKDDPAKSMSAKPTNTAESNFHEKPGGENECKKLDDKDGEKDKDPAVKDNLVKKLSESSEPIQKTNLESVERESMIGEESKIGNSNSDIENSKVDGKLTSDGDGNVEKDVTLKTDNIKQEKNCDETVKEKELCQITENDENSSNRTEIVKVKQEVTCTNPANQNETIPVVEIDKKDDNKTKTIDKPKNLETVFLKDRIDSLINSCLSSKPSSEPELELKRSTTVSNVKTPVEKVNHSIPVVKQEKADSNRRQSSCSVRSDDGQKSLSNNMNLSSSHIQNYPMQGSTNQRNFVKEGESLQETSRLIAGPRETTTFQTLIEKVLDNSLSKSKKADSSQSSNGFRPIVDHRISSKNQTHAIKNEIRKELLVKDTSDHDPIKMEAKPDAMSINRSKVVYLKDHIEKVLEKTFQNSARKDSEDVRIQDRTPTTKVDERYQQHREPLNHAQYRERSQSFASEPIRHPIRERTQSLCVRGDNSDLRRHRSLDSYDMDHLGPPKLIKVTEIYPDINRDQGRYLQPPRIDTYDGNSRGSFKGPVSPGGSYSRSPLDQSPVSPYYNHHSPNSWHGHSPREQHVIPSNLSPNHSVHSPVFQSTRYPVSPGNSFPSNMTLPRYNNIPPLPHATPQISAGSRAFQPPYPQTAPLPAYPVSSIETSPRSGYPVTSYEGNHRPGYHAMDGNVRPGYPVGSQQISPNSRHSNTHYHQQHYHVRPPNTQNFNSNEPVNHSKYQTSPAYHYPQMSPRQPPYPTNHPQMSPTTRSHAPYPSHHTQRTTIQPPQQYPKSIDTNQNFQPPANSHHMRQSHGNPVYPQHAISGRNNNPEFVDHPSIHRNAQNHPQVTGPVAPRMSVPVPRSPHFMMEGNGRNPSVSSAMALGPVPSQNYFKQHQTQKPPQLYPSSPPIPSVREFSSSSSNRNPVQAPVQNTARPDLQYRQSEPVEIPPRNPRSPGNHNIVNRPSIAPGQQAPILDLSVKKDSVAESDPDMQPLDLTCKPKSQSSNLPHQRPSHKGITGFEYLVKGTYERGASEENTGTRVLNIPKDNFSENSQYSSQTRAPYSSSSFGSTSETNTVNNSYIQQQSQVSVQSGQQAFQQNTSHALQVPVSPQNSQEKFIPTEMATQSQGQNPVNQQDPKKISTVSRHEPIQNIIGNHSPNDILYLICRLCGQTYGSPYGFRKHFRNQHGFEPRAEHTIVQTISETKTAMQSPPVNQRTLMSGPQSQTEIDREMAQNQNITGNDRAVPNLDENGQFQNERPPSVVIKEEVTRGISTESGEETGQKESLDSTKDSGNTKYLECHECGQTFQLNDFGAYKRHCRQHGHPKINNPFDPNFVADSNKNLPGDSLKNYQETSEGDTSSVCKKCNLPFASELFLKEHMEIMHPEFVDLICKTCKMKFTSNVFYQNHMKNAHVENVEINENTMNVKKRIIEDFEKSQVDFKHEEKISSTSVTKSAADSMVTTASPDSSSDMVKKSSAVVDSQLGPQTPNVQTQSEKHLSESDCSIDDKADITRQNSCDSATPKIEEDNLYLHKKFGTKRKYLSPNTDIIDSKISRKDIQSPANTRSPSVLSTNSCDSEQSNLPEGKTEIIESDQESNMSNSNLNIEDTKSMVGSMKCSVAGKTEARHQLPFVWDRVTRSQVGRKPQKNS